MGEAVGTNRSHDLRMWSDPEGDFPMQYIPLAFAHQSPARFLHSFIFYIQCPCPPEVVEDSAGMDLGGTDRLRAEADKTYA